MSIFKKIVISIFLFCSPLIIFLFIEGVARGLIFIKDSYKVRSLVDNRIDEQVKLVDKSDSYYEIIHKKSVGKKIEWNSRAIIESDTGLRVPEVGHNRDLNNYEKHLILLGGSFTYGSNLNYEDTLDGLFSKNLSNYVIYNLGLAGMGPFQLIKKLKKLEKMNYFKNTPSKGESLYFLITDHMGRMVIDSAHIGDFKDLIHYDVDNNKAQNGEVFKKKYPFYTKFLQLIRSSRVLNYFGVNFPLGPYNSISKGYAQQMCSIIAALEKQVYSVLPKSNFKVVILPGQPEASHILSKCLVDSQVIDLQSVVKNKSYKNERLFFSDGHPRAIYNKSVVDFLLLKLRP